MKPIRLTPKTAFIVMLLIAAMIFGMAGTCDSEDPVVNPQTGYTRIDNVVIAGEILVQGRTPGR